MYNIITEIDILMYNFHNESSRLESYFNQVEARYGIIYEYGTYFVCDFRDY